MSKINTVVFDLAGTLVVDNGSVTDNLQRALNSPTAQNAYSAISKSDIERHMGESKMDTIKNIFQPAFEIIHGLFVGLMMAHYTKGVVLFDDVVPTLIKLRNDGFNIVCNTGFPRQIADCIIGKSALKNLVDFCVTPDDVDGRGRPAPDMIFAAKERLYLPSTSWICKVGDTAADVEEGRNAKVGLNIWKNNGNRPAPQGGGYAIIGQISDVPDIIRKHNDAIK